MYTHIHCTMIKPWTWNHQARLFKVSPIRGNEDCCLSLKRHSAYSIQRRIELFFPFWQLALWPFRRRPTAWRFVYYLIFQSFVRSGENILLFPNGHCSLWGCRINWTSSVSILCCMMFILAVTVSSIAKFYVLLREIPPSLFKCFNSMLRDISYIIFWLCICYMYYIVGVL